MTMIQGGKELAKSARKGLKSTPQSPKFIFKNIEIY